jgi:hypothetical protein
VQFDEPQSVKFAEGNGRKGSRGSLDLTRLDLNLNHLYNEHRVLIERHARKLGHRPLWASMHAYTAVLYCKFRETLSCISPRSSITDRECAIRVARRKLGRPFGSDFHPADGGGGTHARQPIRWRVLGGPCAWVARRCPPPPARRSPPPHLALGTSASLRHLHSSSCAQCMHTGGPCTWVAR